MLEKNFFISVFADASYCPRTKAAGFGGWVKFGNPAETLRLGGRIEGCNSPLDAEIEAIIMTLNQALESGRIIWSERILVIQTDCQGAISRAGNKIKAGLKPLKLQHIKFKWVKAHQGYVNARAAVNEYCDKTAYHHMTQMRAELDAQSKVEVIN